jgi:hypothetical protein
MVPFSTSFRNHSHETIRILPEKLLHTRWHCPSCPQYAHGPGGRSWPRRARLRCSRLSKESRKSSESSGEPRRSTCLRREIPRLRHWHRGVMRTLQESDVLVVGEIREWEGVDYAHDAVAAGNRKGLIILGHAVWEDPGMNECATWLRTFIPEAPVEFIPAGELFLEAKVDVYLLTRPASVQSVDFSAGWSGRQ